MAKEQKSKFDGPAVEYNQVEEEVDAQVAPPREPDSDKVTVRETTVTLDKVITDPSDPLAVQVPDQDEDALSLPIHKLSQPSPEQAFEDGDADEHEAGSGPTAGGTATGAGVEDPERDRS